MINTLLLGFIASLIFIACSSTDQVKVSYDSVVQADTSKATTFFWVIDGLSLRILKAQFEQGNLPNLKRHFLNQNKFYKARTAFPSLTFPNLVSMVSERPVSGHGVYGNKVFSKGQSYNFEEPGSHRALNDWIKDQNIFHRLEKKGLRTVSIGYNFWINTSSYTNPLDLNAAALILEKNYQQVDGHLIESLHSLLQDTDPKRWPDFVFIHLIGLDLTSHDHGPETKQATDYLRHLDAKIGPTLKLIETQELLKKRKVVSMLTADHGFSIPIEKKVDLPSFLKNSTQIRSFNEGRMAAFKFPTYWSREEFKKNVDRLKFTSDLELKVWRTTQGISFQNSQQLFEFPLTVKHTSDPRVNLILDYFSAKDSPDLILILKPGIGFQQNYQGYHGGISEEEMLVPLLMRNGRLKDENAIPFLHELLSFL